MAGMQETDHITLKNGITYLLQDAKARAKLAELLVEVMEKYGADNPPPYPVTSVNGQTGDVTVQGGSGSGIAIQDDEPTDGELVWIDTDDSGTTHIIPEIDDTQESAVDTWSSQKIASEIAGANDSGASYCKMPDGTLIQTGRQNVSHTEVGTIQTQITFGIPFSGTPYVIASLDGTDLFVEKCGCTSQSSTGFKLVTRNEYAGNNAITADWIAFGRWK